MTNAIASAIQLTFNINRQFILWLQISHWNMWFTYVSYQSSVISMYLV